MKLNDLPKIDAALAPQAISTDVLLEKYAKGSRYCASRGRGLQPGERRESEQRQEVPRVRRARAAQG